MPSGVDRHLRRLFEVLDALRFELAAEPDPETRAAIELAIRWLEERRVTIAAALN